MESKAIYEKMSLVMKDIGPIGKDQKNVAQGFKFRGIDQFVNSLHPALVRHGVFMAPKVVKYEQEIREVTRSNGKQGIDKHVSLLVEYTFWTTDGSSVTIGPIAAESLDSGDKATNKALSAALKYALIQTFSIPTEDMSDADSESPEIQTIKMTQDQAATRTVALPPAATGSFRKPKPKAQPTETTGNNISDDWQ